MMAKRSQGNAVAVNINPILQRILPIITETGLRIADQKADIFRWLTSLSRRELPFFHGINQALVKVQVTGWHRQCQIAQRRPL